ncbi:hypothetical protein ACGFNU_01790 [Spirillospora sp. NPDC048911]|uniref:hypothetical protein n=1 Tax=Spirillospora sp. NPDC048911 TaxID=3364527 RepID=UPI003712DCDD
MRMKLMGLAVAGATVVALSAGAPAIAETTSTAPVSAVQAAPTAEAAAKCTLRLAPLKKNKAKTKVVAVATASKGCKKSREFCVGLNRSSWSGPRSIATACWKGAKKVTLTGCKKGTYTYLFRVGFIKPSLPEKDYDFSVSKRLTFQKC